MNLLTPNGEYFSMNLRTPDGGAAQWTSWPQMGGNAQPDAKVFMRSGGWTHLAAPNSFAPRCLYAQRGEPILWHPTHPLHGVYTFRTSLNPFCGTLNEPPDPKLGYCLMNLLTPNGGYCLMNFLTPNRGYCPTGHRGVYMLRGLNPSCGIQLICSTVFIYLGQVWTHLAAPNSSAPRFLHAQDKFEPILRHPISIDCL